MPSPREDATPQSAPASDKAAINTSNPSQDSETQADVASSQMPSRSRTASDEGASGSTPPFASSSSDIMDRSNYEDAEPPNVPPPAYSESYATLDLSPGGLKTQARIEEDGRIGISIGDDSSLVSRLLIPTLRKQLSADESRPWTPPPPGYVPPSLGGIAGEGTPPPPMNVVIHVVGSRGDVQPFVALGKVLKETYGHRVRLATHIVFKDFVTENGLEFFCIGGDPAELMAFMVKNPGLMPGTEAIRNGDIRKRRKGMYEIIQGCWRSCFEAGDGTVGPPSAGGLTETVDDENRPFVADAIIANPPSFAHIHCAEKLGIPLHLMFTMPWSPTQAFPHPLANILKSGADVYMANFLSYVMVELMTWQGLGDIINKFREKQLHLEPLSMMWGPALASRLRIPYTYCWSPSLIPKPKDWNRHITVSGFYFLSLGSSYQPDPDLAAFLEAGPPPVYIGFGSIVVEDPNVMTNLIFDAVKLSGQRALVSKGWGGFGGDDLQVPEGVFMLGNVPHDWLFKHVSCVVHHGGAGTTAAGIALGKPTVIVPFFGDQPFWGAMVARAGAGPDPIPSKELTAEKLAAAIKTALEVTTLQRAKELGESIAHEKGTDVGAKSFHDQLDVDMMRCSLAPSRVAVWQVKRSDVKLSAMAAALLIRDGKLELKDLRLYRTKECDTEDTPVEPISGATAALFGTTSSLMMGITDIPVDIFKVFARRSSAGPSEEGAQDPKSPNEGESTPTIPAPSKDSALSQETVSTPTIETPTRQGRSFSSKSTKSNSSFSNKGKSPVRGIPSLEDAADATRGIGRIVDASLKSPMDFTMALATGFRNAPKLYGDDTVRPVDRITGISSGLTVATKEFGFGLYDGISGLVTQPMIGAKKGGVAGFLKGFGKGIGGVVFKPGAAVWGLPGYTFKGIYKELKKQGGAGIHSYMIAARTAQGIDEVNHSTEAEWKDVVARWDALQSELTRQRRQWISRSFMSSSNASNKSNDNGPPPMVTKPGPSSASENVTELPARNWLQPPGAISPDNEPRLSNDPSPAYEPRLPSGLTPEYEEAVRKSVAVTSQGDPQEDAQLEEAIRDSLAEFLKLRSRDGDDEDLAKAARKSLAETASRGGIQPARQDSNMRRRPVPTADDPGVETDEDEHIKKAIEESKAAEHQGGAVDDEELARALEESRRAHEENERSQAQEDAVIEYMKKHSLAES